MFSASSFGLEMIEGVSINTSMRWTSYTYNELDLNRTRIM